jgi:hypothetical protein
MMVCESARPPWVVQDDPRLKRQAGGGEREGVFAEKGAGERCGGVAGDEVGRRAVGEARAAAGRRLAAKNAESAKKMGRSEVTAR